MRTIAAALAVLLVVPAVHAGRDEPVRYLELINRTHDRMTALAITKAGDDEFHERPLAAPLSGGGGSITIEILGEDCRQDFRFTFASGRTLVYRDIDICRHQRLYIRRPRRVT